jgi:hypothetical protein
VEEDHHLLRGEVSGTEFHPSTWLKKTIKDVGRRAFDEPDFLQKVEIGCVLFLYVRSAPDLVCEISEWGAWVRGKDKR